MVAVIGPNGAGKTSLLRSIAGIEADEGKVRIEGEDASAALASATDAAPVVPARHAQPDLADHRAGCDRAWIALPDPAGSMN